MSRELWCDSASSDQFEELFRSPLAASPSPPDSDDNLTGGCGMRCNDWCCNEMVLGVRSGRAILDAGGPPMIPVPARCVAAKASWQALLAAMLWASVFLPATVAAQLAARSAGPSTSRIAAIAAEEDARGRIGFAATTAALSDRDPLLRQIAVRALGRQQSPSHLEALVKALHDPVLLVRQEAVTAVGQAAQGFRVSMDDNAQRIEWVRDTLSSRPAADPAVLGVVARTIGRLPHRDSLAARRAEQVILQLLPAGKALGASPPALEGVLHGLYGLARTRRATGTPSDDATGLMRVATVYRRTGAAAEPAARVRRLAHLGLIAAGRPTAETVQGAIADSDDQVRRLAMTAQAQLTDTLRRLALVRQGLRDRAPMVRHEAVRAWRAFGPREGCAPLIAALGDRNTHVGLAALDGLTTACRDADRAGGPLIALVSAPPTGDSSLAGNHGEWQRHGHALMALARIMPARVRATVRRDAAAAFWGVRLYAVRAAAILRDTSTLIDRAADPHGNVREAALAALSAVVGHAADSLYIRALSSPDYQVVLQAATALRASPNADQAIAPMFAALERITSERRETSRDPRIALLDRIGEAGTARHADRLRPFQTDFDSTVAMRAAAILTQWTGTRTAAEPRPLQRPTEKIEELLTGEWRARFTMAPRDGRGSFEVLLHPREAPYTVARFIRLARAGYYNGLTFHRVEPGFVIQGGSPAATEYVGDGPFMRDELGARSHTRGTLGISTRGRDTGDAQLFVNLTDNFRLDHDYTVFGEIVQGRDVAERVLEADVIERVEIVRSR